ncbi:MAG TPA: hypothetical protein VK066_07915 [Chloroflexota bacterium]|nr:hypothetical protein [Chloroflexota bacterium]
MAQRRTYAKAINVGRLWEQLGAAGITPTNAWVREADCILEVADDVNLATLDSLVAAHDPTQLSAAEQQAQQDHADLSGYLAVIVAAGTQTQQAINVLQAATWDTLTAAQRTNAVALILGNQLRFLKALAVLARRAQPS